MKSKYIAGVAGSVAGTNIDYFHIWVRKPRGPKPGLWGDEVTEKARIKHDKYCACIDRFNEDWGPLNTDDKANEELKDNVEMFCYTAHIEDHDTMKELEKEAEEYTLKINMFE